MLEHPGGVPGRRTPNGSKAARRPRPATLTETSMRDNSSLTWSWIHGYRFEALALVAIIAVSAIGEGGAVAYGVGRLFGPINRAIEALTAAL